MLCLLGGLSLKFGSYHFVICYEEKKNKSNTLASLFSRTIIEQAVENYLRH